ncbi:MAG: sigma-70 family RNA polymerase sigma factor [Acidobacteriota bacterium]|nr:sigma-70 family RNA polymerase sigma factor [Acidobacteriota bacterium]
MLSSPVSATFEQLALPLLPSLYSHALWLCRNHAEAEDLVQEAISKALRGFDSFESGTNFKAWIFRILRNAFLTSRTGIAASRTVYLEDNPDLLDIADASPTPEDHLLRLDNEAAVRRALDQLQAPLREVLLLCDVEELKYKDIALVLEVPIGTVMSRISRARRGLHQLLQLQLRESQ